MTTLRQAAKQALDALEAWRDTAPMWWDMSDTKAVTALREALAEQPAQREWVGLDEHDFDFLFLNEDGIRFAKYIEAHLKEKND